ncbi:hypothetical protein DQ04_03651030 [Trypanosoma grayi]|uniref:hypothetical protein n=1 Tax=Trypanosoma grayi TaxID=71804 RepID=UPI0004F43643|nr:hypothetical protein DQ04_03651030 [Trypanosoma grayi]KEG10490.1 hypothetical protein DQ04_03651030 [Trypanosoma grayi]
MHYPHQFLNQHSNNASNNDVDNAYDNIVTHGDASSLTILVEPSPRGPSGANTNSNPVASRSSRRPSNLRLSSSLGGGALLSHMTTQDLGVRRAAESLVSANTVLTNGSTIAPLRIGMDSAMKQVLPLGKDAVPCSNELAGGSNHHVVASALDTLYRTVPVPNVCHTSFEAEVEAATGALRGDSVACATQPSSNRSASTLEEGEITARADSPVKGKETRVLCLQDALKGVALSADSHNEGTLALGRQVQPEVAVAFQASSPEASKIPPRSERGIFGLFGSIEYERFGAFAALFRRHRSLLDSFLERVLQSNQDLYPKELNIMEFLRNSREAPDGVFCGSPLLTWPLHVLYTTSCFYVTAKLHGYYEVFEALRLRGGLLVSGKDIFSALAVAMSPTEEELVYHTSRMYRAAFYVGSVYSVNEEPLQAGLQDCSHQSFALLLVNISTTSLQLLVDEVNRVHLGPKSSGSWCGRDASHAIPLSRVEITRVIGPRSAVVCGHPVDLERLSIILVGYANATGVKVHREYLPATVPLNSSFYNQLMYLRLLQLWEDNGVEIDVSSLRLTVYSPMDGQPWNNTSKCVLADQVALAVTCEAQDLTYSLSHLRDDDVVLGFSFTFPCVGQLIAWTQRKITVLSEPEDRVGENVLPSPRRSAADGVLHTTLSKCAKINAILQSMEWEEKSCHACVEDLSTSFLQLGLLVSVGDSARASAVANQQPELPSETPFSNHVDAGVDDDLGNIIRTYSHDQTMTGGQFHRIDNMVTNPQSGGPARANAGDGILDAVPRYVVLPDKKLPPLMNVYQVPPIIRYYEMQFKCALTRGAVEFAQQLARHTGFAFPPHTLLMCPTVMNLMELWDTYEFLLRGQICEAV